MKDLIKRSCYGSTKVSSKRIIMYIFTAVVIGMIAIEAVFSVLVMIKWFKEGGTPVFGMVLPATLYGYVFGLIIALAGINGFSRQGQGQEYPARADNTQTEVKS